MMRVGITLLIGLLIALTPAKAGHELPYYPSFYPQEIRIEVVDLSSAATRLQNGSIHAYIGREPVFGETVSDTVHSTESLGSYLVVAFNSEAEMLRDWEARCSFARTMVTTLTAEQEDFVFHPYPVTPYHMDYLHHFDLVEAAKWEYRTNDQGSVSLPLTVRGRGNLAEKLVRAIGQVEEGGDATGEGCNHDFTKVFHIPFVSYRMRDG